MANRNALKHLPSMDERVAKAEQKTGAQIVLAVVEKCDSYPELPWKAFALGAAAAGLAVSVNGVTGHGWPSGTETLTGIALTLAVGVTAALMCVYWPAFARLFLDARRASAEVRQYASALFLSREMFATRRRTGILLLVSLFERNVVVLPDRGLDQRLGGDDLNVIIARMTQFLKQGKVPQALEEGLAALEELLAGTASGGRGENELADGVVEEKGV